MNSTLMPPFTVQTLQMQYDIRCSMIFDPAAVNASQRGWFSWYTHISHRNTVLETVLTDYNFY